MNEYASIVVDFLKRHGPSQPVQLRQALNKDTFMASAILSDVVKSSFIKSTLAKIGNSPLYYLPEQEEIAKSKIFEYMGFLEKKLVNRIKDAEYIMDASLSVQDKFIIKNCFDFLVSYRIHDEIVWRYYKVPEQKIIERFSEKKQSVEAKEEKIVFMEPQRPIEENPFLTAENMLKNMNAEITSRSQKNKNESVMTATLKNGSIQQNYFVKIHLKKKINESDLSLAYTEGTEKKMPVLFMTNGDMTKATEKSLNKKFGDLMRIIKL